MEYSWDKWSKEELETQYSPSCWSHRLSSEVVLDAHITAIQKGTEQGRVCAQTMLDIPYGPGPCQLIDVYLPRFPCPNPPVLIYIHGGYWQLLSKDLSGFMVPPLVDLGIVVVAPEYTMAPKGDLDQMVAEMRKAVAFVAKQYSQFSGIYLCGHSAGAHLVAMVLATDWSQPEYGIQPNIRGAMLVSGVYDLRPLLNTYVNDPLKLNMEAAVRNSPELFPDAIWASQLGHRLVIAVGQHDPPEFRRQSLEFHQRLVKCGLPAVLIDVAKTDHFDIVERFNLPDYELTQALKKLIYDEEFVW